MELRQTDSPSLVSTLKIELNDEAELLKLRPFDCKFDGKNNYPSEVPIENFHLTLGEEVPRIPKQIKIGQLAELVMEEITMHLQHQVYYVGPKEKRLFCGPVLQVIPSDTYLVINGTQALRCLKPPINEEGSFEGKRLNQIAIKPGPDLASDYIIIASENGCYIVLSGAYVLFDLPIVLIRANGTYFTISEPVRNLLMLKKGANFIAYTNHDGRLPIVFARKSIYSGKAISFEDATYAEQMRAMRQCHRCYSREIYSENQGQMDIGHVQFIKDQQAQANLPYKEEDDDDDEIDE